MKKILVSGCVNCPYFKIWKDEGGTISSGECKHPSFYVQAGLPGTGIPKRLFYCINETGRLEPGGSPSWCPLPNEIGVYLPACTSMD